MFNSPVLDVTIGLVLIFLLYSLLATTINEGIATLFGLRARMLRNAIQDHMLSKSQNDSRKESIARGFSEFFTETKEIVTGSKGTTALKIGDHFFNHPLIKTYGATAIYPRPSYISSANFSTVLIDELRKEFSRRVGDIVQDKLDNAKNQDSAETLRENLMLSPDLVKIKEVLDYYGRHYLLKKSSPADSIIDEETWQILQLKLRESGYHWDRFVGKIESWFDDTMNRVSGWYKRQTQTILFFLGLVIAGILNVDTIQLAERLSRDKEAREKVTQLAIQSIDTYKDDPRIQKKGTSVISDSSGVSSPGAEISFLEYQRKLDSLVHQAQSDLEEANNVLALGWKKKHGEETGAFTFYDGASKAIGFLLTALAICLGAPFWFDLLNKLVKIRGAGVKESSESPTLSKGGKQTSVVPVLVKTSTGEEAVG